MERNPAAPLNLRSTSAILEPAKTIKEQLQALYQGGAENMIRFRRAVAAILFTGALGHATLILADDVRIAVNAASIINTMRGGIGASWHAIEEPIPYRPGHSDGGSAWGANPPAGDDAAWKQLYRHADWLGMDWLRVEIEQRMYQPERGRFDFDSPEMLILYRILDWCQRRNADVFFQQMWGNVKWNTFPEWRDDPSRRVHSGPLSMDDFAAGLAELMDHLVRKRGYTCIRWLSITNEPGFDWSWWQEPPNRPMPLRSGLAAVRKALDRRGLDLPLSGPDWTDLPALDAKKIDFDELIGAYDLHSYFAHFDGQRTGYPLAVAEKHMADWVAWAHERRKPFFLSELGTMVFGWRDSNPGPGTYDAGLKDAELVVRAMNLGVDGFNRWSYTNRGDLDGHWQLVDTWDPQAKRLLEQFSPHPNTYYLYGLLSRFTAKHSAVLRSKVEGGRLGRQQRVFAAAIRSPGGQLTLLVVNDAEPSFDAAFTVEHLPAGSTLYRYRVTPADRDRSEVRIESSAEFRLTEGKATFADCAPGTERERLHDA